LYHPLDLHCIPLHFVGLSLQSRNAVGQTRRRRRVFFCNDGLISFTLGSFSFALDPALWGASRPMWGLALYGAFRRVHHVLYECTVTQTVSKLHRVWPPKRFCLRLCRRSPQFGQRGYRIERRIQGSFILILRLFPRWFSRIRGRF
jgi:hypothetical protein